jgi:hypothetical protein
LVVHQCAVPVTAFLDFRKFISWLLNVLISESPYRFYEVIISEVNRSFCICTIVELEWSESVCLSASSLIISWSRSLVGPKCVLWFKAVFAPLSHGMNSRGRFNASQFHSVSSQGGVIMRVRDRVCTPPCDETPWNCEALKVKLKHPRLFIPWLRGANTALNHKTHFG